MSPLGYEQNPCYPPAGGKVTEGWGPAVAQLPERPMVLAVDGPALLDWDRVAEELCRALRARGSATQRLDLRDWSVPWPEVARATSSPALAEDPDFDRLADGDVAQLSHRLPMTDRPPTGALVAFGPGAALLT